jgi:proline iminopeptidase
LRADLPRQVRRELESFESRGAYHDPAYEDLVFREYYSRHICRLPEWPEPMMRSLHHVNQHVYEYMQGPSEFVPGGALEHWSVWGRLDAIRVPTLTVGARYDTSDPADMERMSRLVQHGRHLYCPHGSHLAMWDDQGTFMTGVVRFLQDVQAGRF